MNEEWRDELITKGAAFDALNEVMIAYIPRLFGGLEEIPLECAMAIVKMPSAQHEIIRCRDCRFYEWMSNRVPEEQTWFCHNWNAETGKDDYCSYAERRQNETAQ